jgi:transcriptional regulator with XRE-family HTH domain
MTNEISKIIDELIHEDSRTAREIAEAANISSQLLSSYRNARPFNCRSQPWQKLQAVLSVLGYELEIMKIHNPKQDALDKAWENFEGAGAEL